MAESPPNHQNDDVQQPPETPETTTSHHLTPPSGLTPTEFTPLIPHVIEHHTYTLSRDRHQCSSLLAQKIHAPPAVVWSILRRFDKPQTYKHFIKSCSTRDHSLRVGSTRCVNVISGLPAATSTERLDILDDSRFVTGFTITGGEHRLRNYRSVTTVHALIGEPEAAREGEAVEVEEGCVVLESYLVDVPEGNTVEDTRLFADTVVKLNLQKLGSVAVGLARDGLSG